MSAVGTITTLASKVAGTTVHAVSHPVQSATYVVGRARGVAGTLIGGGARTGPASGSDVVPGPDQAPPPTTNATPAPPREPTTPPEPVATEPSAPSRNAAHGGPGGPGDSRFDDPAEELGDDEEVETPVGTTGAGRGYNPDTTETDLQQPGTEPLMDPSLTKSVKAEAETLSKAAEPDKG